MRDICEFMHIFLGLQELWFYWSVSALYWSILFGTASYFKITERSSERQTVYFNMECQMLFLAFCHLKYKYCHEKHIEPEQIRGK